MALLDTSTLLTPPTANEAVSGIFGSISLIAWICLLLPQLLTNYRAQSADGLSMGFLFIWLAGDATNLSGALFTNLAPSAIGLASYFCFADMVLITQCLYYNAKNAGRATRRGRRRPDPGDDYGTAPPQPSERDPLLARRRSKSAGLPGSLRRQTTHEESSLEPLRKIIAGEDETPDSNPWLHNTISLLAVYVVGAVLWFAAYKAGWWDTEVPIDVPAPGGEDVTHTIGTVLGYLSACFYLCARIPQIIKNYRDKSCEGLALLFFMLSITGNMAYGFSLLAYSQEPKYLLTALPWLLGSLGTIVEDSIIFVQFRLYASNPRSQLSDA